MAMLAAVRSDSPLLTIEQVAAQLQVDPRTVRHYCYQGDLEFVKFGHRTFRFKPEWIEQFIQRKQRAR